MNRQKIITSFKKKVHKTSCWEWKAAIDEELALYGALIQELKAN